MNKTLLLVAGGAVVLAVLFIFDRRATPAAIGQAAGGALVDAGAGAVIGIGEAIGIPQTSMTECERAIAEGRTWDASFACPAGTFIKSLFN